MSEKLFQYNHSHLSLSNRGPSGDFDKKLKASWESAQSRGLFRYPLKLPLPSKVLPGKYGFFLQLNEERAIQRRKPQEIQSVNQSFNPTEFNFNKVSPDEVLFCIKRLHANDGNDSVLLINVSPLEYGHALLTPYRSRNNPQIVTKGGLKLALELALLSVDGDLRVGFNSLCGYASVNHEHYHLYYLRHRLYLESAELKSTLTEESVGIPFLHELIDYPAPAFVFVLKDSVDELDEFVEGIVRLTDYLKENEIAHNIFVTRGKEQSDHDSLRVYLWARESSYGSKQCDAFNPALCELGGHFPCKNETSYASLTEQFIIELLQGICLEIYQKVRQHLLKQNDEITAKIPNAE